MADIFTTISKDTTVSEITRVARVGRNPQTGKEIQMAARKRPGRTKYSNIVLKRIAEKLKDINPLFAVRFEREQQDEVAISSYNKLLTPAKKVVKFKAGAELSDSVKSVEPADVKKLAEELVNLTVKDTNETSQKEEPKKEEPKKEEPKKEEPKKEEQKKDSEPMEADSDDDGLLDGKVESADEAESLKAKFEEAGAEVELK